MAAQPEDQLKAPVKRLLEATLSRTTVARSEAQVAGLGGRPDFGVAVDGLLAGYAELKAPGLGARPQRFTDERNKKQWGKFKTLPNLIYTDGNEWTLLILSNREARRDVGVGLDVLIRAVNAVDPAALKKENDVLTEVQLQRRHRLSF